LHYLLHQSPRPSDLTIIENFFSAVMAQDVDLIDALMNPTRELTATLIDDAFLFAVQTELSISMRNLLPHVDRNAKSTIEAFEVMRRAVDPDLQ
jgi:hypothetical protein